MESAVTDYYHLKVDRDLAEQFEEVSEEEGWGGKSKAMKYALKSWLRRWRRQQAIQGLVEAAEGEEVEIPDDLAEEIVDDHDL